MKRRIYLESQFLSIISSPAEKDGRDDHSWLLENACTWVYFDGKTESKEVVLINSQWWVWDKWLPFENHLTSKSFMAKLVLCDAVDYNRLIVWWRIYLDKLSMFSFCSLQRTVLSRSKCTRCSSSWYLHESVSWNEILNQLWVNSFFAFVCFSWGEKRWERKSGRERMGQGGMTVEWKL